MKKSFHTVNVNRSSSLSLCGVLIIQGVRQRSTGKDSQQRTSLITALGDDYIPLEDALRFAA